MDTKLSKLTRDEALDFLQKSMKKSKGTLAFSKGY
jgi:hypothetical protein